MQIPIAKFFVSYVIGRNHKVQSSISLIMQIPIARFFVSYVIGRNHKVQSSKLKVQRIERISPYVILSKDAAYTKKKEHSVEYSFCDSDRIQTCNLLIRSQVLYSVELRNHCYGCKQMMNKSFISELRVQRYCFLFVLPNVLQSFLLFFFFLIL